MSSVDHLHVEAEVLKVREQSELLPAQYFARCRKQENVSHSITTRNTSKRRMKETLFTRHHNTVEPMMIAKDRKATLQAIHTNAVNNQEKNVVLDDRPHPPTQVRSRHCRLLGSCKSRIKDARLNVCDDCGNTPHDVMHLFICPAHPTTQSDLWSRPMNATRTQLYRDTRTRLKGEQRQSSSHRNGLVPFWYDNFSCVFNVEIFLVDIVYYSCQLMG